MKYTIKQDPSEAATSLVSIFATAWIVMLSVGALYQRFGLNEMPIPKIGFWDVVLVIFVASIFRSKPIYKWIVEPK